MLMAMTSLQRGIALSIFAAQLGIAGCAHPERDFYYSNLIKCHGVNGCRGLSDCSSSFNSCKAKNRCKGEGWLALPADVCVQEQIKGQLKQTIKQG
jgi:hypothetical protein